MRVSSDVEKVAAIRHELPPVQQYVYLNTGSNGPLPKASYIALQNQALREWQEGRTRAQQIAQVVEMQEAARIAFAGVLGCAPDEVALTHSTTEGINIALMGLNWQPGDEVISATTEHSGGLYPLFLLEQRYGVALRMTQIGVAGLDPVAALQHALQAGRRTRAVILSHVSWSTGRVLPVAELARVAHEAGALFICDAAQSCGMVPSDVEALGADVYACAGQKWLCGPQGAGAVYVRRERMGEIQQTFIGTTGIETNGFVEGQLIGGPGAFVPPAGAKRYEALTLHPSSVLAMTASLEWLTSQVGWEWIYRRIQELGKYCYQELRKVPGVTIHTPAEAMAGLVHFHLEGIVPAKLTERLEQRDVLIRDVGDPAVNRVSTGFYNTREDIDHLIDAILAIKREPC